MYMSVIERIQNKQDMLEINHLGSSNVEYIVSHFKFSNQEILAIQLDRRFLHKTVNT